MTVYADYAQDEQQLLLASLDAAGIVVSAASIGRGAETASEGIAVATLILDSRDAYVDNTLVSSVILAISERVKAEQPFPNYAELAVASGAEDEALFTLRSVVSLLDAKATPDEAADYKAWLLQTANAAAAAGMEDQGFLGCGGVVVDDAERIALAEIAAVLRIAAR
jgi:hypothetical protein